MPKQLTKKQMQNRLGEKQKETIKNAVIEQNTAVFHALQALRNIPCSVLENYGIHADTHSLVYQLEQIDEDMERIIDSF